MPDWPYAPLHRLHDAGAYMVTAGTYRKAHHFRGAARLSFLQEKLLSTAVKYDWHLQAWGVFSNHYHLVAISPSPPGSLRRFIQELHSGTAREINREDGEPGRQIWFQYSDKFISFERSYLARLNYVHHNPVHHGLVADASLYRWCSASWFEREATPAFVRVVKSFKSERLAVPDDFEVISAADQG